MQKMRNPPGNQSRMSLYNVAVYADSKMIDALATAAFTACTTYNADQFKTAPKETKAYYRRMTKVILKELGFLGKPLDR